MKRAAPDDAERAAMGWEVAYDLRAWQEYPGRSFADPYAVASQQLVGGVLGGLTLAAPEKLDAADVVAAGWVAAVAHATRGWVDGQWATLQRARSGGSG